MKRLVTLAAVALGFAIFAGPATAQQYPTKNITLIVPYPAGGPTDQTARLLAQEMSDKLKQSVIVENVSGGGTTIATNRVARAAPDGYTVLIHNLQISANPALYKSLPFDTEKDLKPVIFINNNPLVLVGRKGLPANTLPELMALMKKQSLRTATPGVGSTGHLASSLLAQEAGVKIDLIPYRGAAPALQDILGEHVDVFFATPQSVAQQVASGTMKAYGLTSKDKASELPNVESFVSVLGPKLQILYWHAMFVPTGTPDAIVNKLNATMQEILNDPKIVKTWAATGVSVYPKDQQTTAAAAQLFKSEMDRWGQVVRDNKIEGQL